MRSSKQVALATKRKMFVSYYARLLDYKGSYYEKSSIPAREICMFVLLGAMGGFTCGIMISLDSGFNL